MDDELPKKRGRPRKSVDSAPQVIEPAVKKRRGRPKKSPSVENAEEISETFNLVAKEHSESASKTLPIQQIENSKTELTVKEVEAISSNIKISTESDSVDVENEFPILIDKNVKEIEAGSIVIETKFRADESTKVVNYVNGKIIDENDNEKTKAEIVNCDSEENNLFLNRVLINDVNTSDSGNYALLLANKYKRIIIDYNINIDPKFEKCWITSPAEYTRFPNFLRLRFGIRCLSKFDVKWSHDGVDITEEHRQTIDKTGKDRYFITLTIQKPTYRQNAGLYVCQVNSEHNSVKAQFNLELDDKRPTVVNEPTIELEIENTLILTVEYRSEIKSTVLWKSPDGQTIDEKSEKSYLITTKCDKATPISTTQLKLISYKSSQHSGIYLCEVSNSSGTLIVELNVERNLNLEKVS